MRVNRPSRRPETLLLIILFVLFIILTLQVRRDERSLFEHASLSLIGPLVNAFNTVSRASREGFDAYFWQRDAALRAERLALENRLLRGRILSEAYLSEENERLRLLLNIPLEPEVERVGARVLSPYGAPFRRYLLVSLEPSISIPNLAPVISEDGAVGRMQGGTGGLLRCVLLTDPNSAIGVVGARSGVHGVAVGRGEGHLALRWVSNEADVRENDLFVTSGSDGIFPAEVPVGTVTSVRDGPDYLKRTVLEPAVAMESLGWVVILVQADA